MRRKEIRFIALESKEARKAQQAADERKTHDEGVSTKFQAKLEGQEQGLDTRAKGVEQAMIKLRAQYVQNVESLHWVIQQQVEGQKTSAKNIDWQMAQIMAIWNKVQPTPTHSTPVEHAAEEPMEPSEVEVRD